jgi:hypothetical protein
MQEHHLLIGMRRPGGDLIHQRGERRGWRLEAVAPDGRQLLAFLSRGGDDRQDAVDPRPGGELLTGAGRTRLQGSSEVHHEQRVHHPDEQPPAPFAAATSRTAGQRHSALTIVIMRYRQLGRSGLTVSIGGLGCNNVSSCRSKVAREQLDHGGRVAKILQHRIGAQRRQLP